MKAPSFTSRITESAAGLAKGLISAPTTDGHPAFETTAELATLRNAHKLSSLSSHNASSPLRLPKPLSGRNRGLLELQSLRQSSDLYSESEFEDEFSGFLSHQCDIGEASSSSSRSGSTMDLTIGNQDDMMQWSSGYVSRHDSLEPELSRSKQKSPSKTLYGIGSPSRGFYEPPDRVIGAPRDSSSFEDQCNKDGRDVPSYGPSSEKTRDYHRALLRTDLGESMAAKSVHNDELALRKQRALTRLQLIFSHMPIVSHAEKAATMQFNNLDTAHNQFCLGEEAQEWAEFEALMLRGSSMQAIEQNQKQTQLDEQRTMVSRPGSMQEHLYKNHTMEHVDQYIGTSRHPPEKEQGHSNDKEPVAVFHCPWVDCHRRFQICTDYTRDATNSDSLPCVHVGCELSFDSEEVWQEHISGAHHDLLPKLQANIEADLEGAWEKVQA